MIDHETLAWLKGIADAYLNQNGVPAKYFVTNAPTHIEAFDSAKEVHGLKVVVRAYIVDTWILAMDDDDLRYCDQIGAMPRLDEERVFGADPEDDLTLN